jgi:hypothetical protein
LHVLSHSETADVERLLLESDGECGATKEVRELETEELGDNSGVIESDFAGDGT